MSANQTDLSGIYTMLEEIKADIKKNGQQPAIKVNAEAINGLADEFRAGIEKMKEPQQVEYRHSFDINASKPFIIFCSMGIILIVLSCIIYHNSRTIKRQNDNDLKYRYILMRGSAAPEDILMLRDVFDYNRNTDSIRAIRSRVEQYERLISEEAERQARAKLNTEQAEKIRQEIETYKN